MRPLAATRAFATIGLAALATCTRPANPEPVVVAIPVYNPPADSQPPMRRAPDAPTRRPMTPPPTRLGVRDVGDTTIRDSALDEADDRADRARRAASMFVDRAGNLLAARDDRRESHVWRIEHEGRRVRAVRSNGARVAVDRWRDHGPVR